MLFASLLSVQDPKFQPKFLSQRVAGWIEILPLQPLHREFPNRGSSQAHQPCKSSRFPLEIRSRTHPASCEAGIPNLPGLLFSTYNEDYGLIPASQGGAVGIARVKALRQHHSEALTNPSPEGLRKKPHCCLQPTRSSHQLPLTGRQFSPQFRLNSSSNCWPYPENSRAGAAISAELPFKMGWCMRSEGVRAACAVHVWWNYVSSCRRLHQESSEVKPSTESAQEALCTSDPPLLAAPQTHYVCLQMKRQK